MKFPECALKNEKTDIPPRSELPVVRTKLVDHQHEEKMAISFTEDNKESKWREDFARRHDLELAKCDYKCSKDGQCVVLDFKY